jgi:dihydrofolate synthase/folylpolyglutamate synthase
MVDSTTELEALSDLEDALNALIQSFRFSSDSNLKLERIEALVHALGDPQRKYRTVHIGGTSGKGTVAAMVASILSRHGHRVGLHVSPYVQTLTETWQLDGRYMLPSRVLETAASVIDLSGPIAEELPFGPVSYFETKVATAFKLFEEERVDIGVIEVGLGGALDATNVLNEGVQVLTNVSLDHTEILGDTVEAIASDKVQIFKPRSTIVSGVVQPTVRAIVRDAASAVGSVLYLLDDEVRLDSQGDSLSVVVAGESVSLAVPAEWPMYQRRNAAIAVVASRFVEPALSTSAVSEALAAVHLPGRVEHFTENGRHIVLDGAHNAEKMRTTVQHMSSAYPGRKCLTVLAVKSGKNIDAVLQEVMPISDRIILTTFVAGLWEPTDPDILAVALGRLGFDGPVEIEPDAAAAVEKAVVETDSGNLILVTGSLYLAGNVRPRWVPMAEDILSGGSYAPAR